MKDYRLFYGLDSDSTSIMDAPFKAKSMDDAIKLANSFCTARGVHLLGVVSLPVFIHLTKFGAV